MIVTNKRRKYNIVLVSDLNKNMNQSYARGQEKFEGLAFFAMKENINSSIVTNALISSSQSTPLYAGSTENFNYAYLYIQMSLLV